MSRKLMVTLQPDWRRTAPSLLAAIIIGSSSQAASAGPKDAPAFDPAAAAAIFAEAQQDCKADAGKLWGVSLCGPVLLVDPASRRVLANRADAEGTLEQVGERVFAGSMPESQTVANTAVEWSGTRWSELVWPLPGEKIKRRQLLAHEAFHRVQERIAPMEGHADNGHLDELVGRYTIQLEWRALGAALAADSRQSRRTAIRDALLFRARRYSTYPSARAAERVLERNEGLAEYTAVMLTRPTAVARNAAAQADIASHADAPSFVRSFAYATGPAYGLLLNRQMPHWRELVDEGRGLAEMLADALSLGLDDMRLDSFAERAAIYGGDALYKAEEARAAERAKQFARYRRQLVDGPILELPLKSLQVRFDPRKVFSLGEHGTVYPRLRVVDDWGAIEITGGALIAPPGWHHLQVPAPSGEAMSGRIQTDTWVLELAAGWKLVPGKRDGDYVLRKTEQ